MDSGSSLLQSGPAPQPAPHSQGKGSRDAPPRCSEFGWWGGLSGWLMQERGGRGGKDGAAVIMSTPPGRPASTDPELRPPATVHVHPAPKTSASIHSLRTCLYHPATTPPLLYSFFTANLSCPTPRAQSVHPHPQDEPSSPGSSCNRSSVCSFAARVPARPAQTGGEGGWDNPPPALRSRAPSRMGVAWLRPSPQRLTSCLCHPPRPGSMAFDAS